jgi:hypothetical protein
VSVIGATIAYPELIAVGDIDNAVASLTFASGTLGVVDLSRSGIYGYDIATEILGLEGTLRIGYLRETPVMLLTRNSVEPLLSDEHFSVDGTLIEAWASHKSFKPKDGSDDGDGSNFHGQTRKNDTHASTTDPQARLYRKAAGRESKLSYMGHAVMENRNGLAVAGTVSQANGTAERRASEKMLKAQAKRSGCRITAGEDKAYDTRDHVAALRKLNATPHVAQNNALTKTGKNRRSAIDGRTTRHIGYAMSQSRRAMIECIFGWGKQHGTMRKTKLRGLANVAGSFMLNLIAYNLIRIPRLTAA